MEPQQATQTPIVAIMHTSPHCVTGQQPVKELLQLFLDHGISAAPVVNAQHEPIGFVSKTDVVRQLRSPRPGTPQEGALSVQPWWDVERLSHLTVETIMTPSVYSFTPETPLADAIAVMAFEGLHHLPVVDASGKLVGMVSALDVLDWIARQAGYTPGRDNDERIFERPA